MLTRDSVWGCGRGEPVIETSRFRIGLMHQSGAVYQYYGCPNIVAEKQEDRDKGFTPDLCLFDIIDGVLHFRANNPKTPCLGVARQGRSCFACASMADTQVPMRSLGKWGYRCFSIEFWRLKAFGHRVTDWATELPLNHLSVSFSSASFPLACLQLTVSFLLPSEKKDSLLAFR